MTVRQYGHIVLILLRTLSSAPTRVSEWVYVRRPEVQAGSVGIVESPSFRRNDSGNVRNELIIECGTHQDGLRKRC